MQSPQYANEAAVNPPEPPAELFSWLTSPTLHLAIGVILGLLAARVMRQRHVRWTWSSVAFAVALVAHSVLGSWTSTVGVAALCGGARGRHWHNEDIMAGGDMAEIAAKRRGPLDALRTLSRRLPQRVGLSSTPT